VPVEQGGGGDHADGGRAGRRGRSEGLGDRGHAGDAPRQLLRHASSGAHTHPHRSSLVTAFSR
jgi:hypothetical protein